MRAGTTMTDASTEEPATTWATMRQMRAQPDEDHSIGRQIVQSGRRDTPGQEPWRDSKAATLPRAANGTGTTRPGNRTRHTLSGQPGANSVDAGRAGPDPLPDCHNPDSFASASVPLSGGVNGSPCGLSDRPICATACCTNSLGAHHCPLRCGARPGHSALVCLAND